MKSAFVFVILLFTTGLAHATGGYSCKIDDQNLLLEIGGQLSHGIPTGPSHKSGKLTLKDASLNGAYDIANISKTAQFWQDDDDLNVMIYEEFSVNGGFAFLKLTIKTKLSGDTGAFKGPYVLLLSPGEGGERRLTGTAECDLE